MQYREQNYNRSQGSIKNRKREKYIRQRKKIRRRMFYLLSFVLFLNILLITGESKKAYAAVTIYIETPNLEMYQNSETPELTTLISVEGDTNYVLDTTYGYTVENLVNELENGLGITTDCEAFESYINGEEMIDGEYILDTHLTEEYQMKLLNEWGGMVHIEIVDGNLNVINKSGYWDGQTFKDWNDNIVENQLVYIEGSTYYLDETGKKVVDSDVQIGLTLYKFDNEGKMISEELYIDSEKPMIALTFDDGVSANTWELLNALEKYDVHATFFMQGANIQDGERDMLKKMVELGCELGNHSTTHANLTTLSLEGIRTEMEDTSARIQELSGELPTVMRPPYGAVDAEVEAAVGLPIILWNVDTLDWKTESLDVVLQNILEEASDGDIILLHDTKSWSVKGAIEAIPILIEQGYQLVTVSELAEARGIELEAGELYYNFPTE